MEGHNALAIVALLLSSLGVLTYVCAPIGAILGHVARRQVRIRKQAGGGMALAAVLIGWGITVLYSCGLLLTVVLVVVKGIAIIEFFGG